MLVARREAICIAGLFLLGASRPVRSAPVPSAAEQAIRRFFADLKLVPRACQVSVKGRSYVGWKAALKDYYLPRLDADQSLFRSLDVRIFQGMMGDEGYRVYAIVGLPILDIIDLFAVGTHNADRPIDACREVRDLMAWIAGADPFDVVFADAAGLEAVFVNDVPRKRARRYGARLVELIRGPKGPNNWYDSVGFMIERLRKKRPSERASNEFERVEILLADYIVTQRRLRLWWD